MAYITLPEAAKLLNVSKQALYNKADSSSYIVKRGPRWFVDTENEEWAYCVLKNKETKTERERNNKLTSERVKRAKSMGKKGQKDEDIKRPEIEDLDKLVLEAERRKTIYLSKIKEEQAKQEEIKTLEMKKELAPVDMIKHFFSFAESLLQRLYRRPHEISPQLASLYAAGEEKKAIALLVRELESIVVDVQKQLIDEMKKEGYKKP